VARGATYAALALLLECLCAVPAKAGIIPAIQISNISDFNLPSWNLGDPAPTAHIDLCLYSLNSLVSGGYNVTATGSNGGFHLVSGPNSIPYSVTWDDSGSGNLGNTAGTQMTSGAALTNQVNANILSVSCALGVTGPNARLNLKIAQADMTAALAGTYSGSITIVVSPN